MRLLDEAVSNNKDPSLKSAFDRLLAMDNVPRKKAKFMNFVQNCCHLLQRKDVLLNGQRTMDGSNAVGTAERGTCG